MEAHELPENGHQQLLPAAHNVHAADVHQRQPQQPPRYAHHLPSHSKASRRVAGASHENHQDLHG